MKVYVSELPKSCEDCVFSETGFVWDSEVRFCKLKPRCMNWIALYDKKRKDCTLCCLSDYTKQVRKEVCDNFRKTAIQYYKKCDIGSSMLSVTDVWEILDQIQLE